jgi:hypothetical protein
MATNKPFIGPEVVFSDKKLNTLLSYYKAATTQIISELESATDFGRARRLQVLSNIDKILQKLDKNTSEWFKGEVRIYYETYSKDAVNLLDDSGFPVTVSFSRIDEQAIQTLSDDVMSYYREAYSGVKRAAMRMLNDSARDQVTALLAEGKISGETRKAIADKIAGLLKEGLVALIDRGGRKWSLEAYANMLTRTMLVKTANQGLQNRLIDSGYDLVQVSDHAGSCNLCAPWQGRILSMSGKHPSYPTVTEAEMQGLHHPNCRHRLLPYHEKLLEVSVVWNPETQRYIGL